MRRWMILALVLGLSACFVVAALPDRPLWTGSQGDPARVIAISQDGRRLYAVHGNATNPGSLQFLSTWDLARGVPLERRALPSVSPREYCQLAPGEETLCIVGNGTTQADGQPVRIVHLVHLPSMSVRAGPIPIRHLNPETFSADGQWFWAYTGQWRVTVYSSADGRPVYQSQAGRGGVRCQFSPDCTSMAVRYKKAGSTETSQLQVVRLPDGKVLHDFELPKGFTLNSWPELDRLVLECSEHYDPTNAGTYRTRKYRFDLRAAAPQPVELPELESRVDGRSLEQVHRERRPDRTIVESHYQFRLTPIWPELAHAWFEEKGWGTVSGLLKPFVRHPIGTRVRILSPDGRRVLCSFECPNTDCTLAPDGRYLAYSNREGIIYVWQTVTTPRWVYAACTGFVVGGAILLIGRWRVRRRASPLVPAQAA